MRRSLVALAAALLFSTTPLASPQSAGFSGRYRLTLRFSSSCRAAVASVSVTLDLTQARVTAGAEVSGRPSIADEANAAQLVLLQRQTTLHGPFSTLGGRTDRESITTGEGLLVIPWLMLDGTSGSASGRSRASGTAFGVLQVGRPEDEYPDTLGSCSARDHSWALEPL